MEQKKAENISIILAGTGVILALMPLFNIFPERESALILSGFISFMGAFVFRELAKKGK